jgi:hypothetical protein
LKSRGFSDPGRVSVDQRAHASPSKDLVRTDRDTVAPLPNLRDRQSMRHGRRPDFYIERRPRCDRFAPVMALQEGGARGRSFEERFRRHVDRMPDAAVILEADCARLKRHLRRIRRGVTGQVTRGRGTVAV